MVPFFNAVSYVIDLALIGGSFSVALSEPEPPPTVQSLFDVKSLEQPEPGIMFLQNFNPKFGF